MQYPNNSHAQIQIDATSEPREASSEPDSREPRPWNAEANRLLRDAAALCIANDVDLDTFMSGAWAIYVEARPGMRAHIEETQLREQLDELRKLGRIATA